MAFRTFKARDAQLRELLESPRGTVGQHFQKVSAAVTRECKAEAGRKLQRGTGPGPRYADSFRSQVETGARGLRFRVENTKQTASGRALAPIIEKGSRPHIIRPRKATVLVFQSHGETVFAREVNHPGTKAYRIMETALRRVVRRGR